MLKLGIPYMGSKRAIASDIVHYILEHNPNCKYVYDLFGGGGAISFEFLKHGKQVFYNELNTTVCELLKKIMTDGVTPEFYKWVSREEFKEHVNGNDWRAGLIKTCWSFGNNSEKGYMFSEENEPIKELLHKCIIYGEKYKELSDVLGVPINEKTFIVLKSNSERKINLQRYLKKNIKDVKADAVLSCIRKECILPNLNGIEQLERLQQLQLLHVSNLSYEQVEIVTPVEETIIYLDPPYESTEKYQKGLCHRELENYIENSPYKIYISSYDFNLPVVWEKYKRCKLSATANNKVIEKLFCNRPETIKSTLF